ncbi:sugar phosphate isomerase/epimerase family protein, partial [Yersinia pestis]
GKMDIFDFIDKAWSLGLDGVEINIIPDEGLHPEFGVLSSDDPTYLARVRHAIEQRNLYCEIDTRFTSVKAISKAVQFASALGADVIRTYMFRRGQYEPLEYPRIIHELKSLVPLLQANRIRLAVENHEDETADEIIQIVKAVDSLWVGAHCDIGNGMMAWEEPVVTVSQLAPFTYSTHFKDHIVTQHDEQLVVCGVPIGEGSIDIDNCFRILVEKSGITRVNIETCFPYASAFSRPCNPNEVSTLKGTFEVKTPPFDSSRIKPLEYYYPDKISPELLQELMQAQDHCVYTSVQVLKALRDKYCPNTTTGIVE